MATEQQLAMENLERFAYARDNGHLDFVAKASKCDAYVRGAQWDEEVRDRLERLGKPIITMNKVLSTMATVFGEQIANRADVSYKPYRDANADTAKALDKTWVHLSHANNLNWVESSVAADGFIRSRGFYDMRMNWDDNFYGEVHIKALNSKNVVIDPDASSYDPDDWSEVFITKWLNLQQIENVYGDAFARELKQRPEAATHSRYDAMDWEPDGFRGPVYDPGQAPISGEADKDMRRIYRIVERQFKETHFVQCFLDPTTGNLEEIPTNWSRERIGHVMRLTGWQVYRKRRQGYKWVTSLDNIVLHNSMSPYQHFTPIPYFPFFFHGQTVGLVENLLSPQDLLNKSISQELHIVTQTANSGWIVRDGQLVNMTPEELEERGGEDGLVIVVNGEARNAVSKIQPNQVPTGLDRVTYKADEGLKEVSMVGDSMRGMDRADVAAKAIQTKAAMGSVALAKPMDNLAETRRMVARNAMDLVQQFYTEERIMYIVGRDLGHDPEELVVNQRTPEGEVVNDLSDGKYTVYVTSVPAREDYEESQFQQLVQMRAELGIAIPDHFIVEASHVDRKTELAEQLRAISGTDDPSEMESAVAELELQLKQLEVDEKQVRVALDAANVELTQARAQSEQTKGGGQGQTELLKVALEREKMLAEIELERAKVEEELTLKWQEFNHQKSLDNAKAAHDMKLAEKTADHQAKAAEEKPAKEK